MTQTQIKALNALATTRNLSEAAEKAGISRKTLYHYIHNVYEFATAYREILNWQIAQTMDDLQQRRENALSVASEILNNKKERTENRLKAAQIILSESDKAIENAQKANLVLEGQLREIEVAKDKIDFMADIYAPPTAEELKAVMLENPYLFPKLPK